MIGTPSYQDASPREKIRRNVKVVVLAGWLLALGTWNKLATACHGRRT